MTAAASSTLAERIDRLLPQTQCTRCGYPACRPYADAIAAGVAPINRCPPGGEATIAALAALTAQRAQALDPACGEHAPLTVARVDESACIGCTLCIAACPVDAIVGARLRMHTVLWSQCTGCALCLPPCPVDCIEMVPAERAWTHDDAAAARARFEARNTRLARRERLADRAVAAAASAGAQDAALARKAAVDAAIARARARRGAASKP